MATTTAMLAPSANLLLLASPQLYTAQHLHAKDHHTPAGDNPNTQG